MNAQRRSWLVVAAHDPGAAERARNQAADVIVLDLEYSVPPKAKEAAREGLKAMVRSLRGADADIFVRIDRETRWADAAAAVERGVRGIVFPGPETTDEVAELDTLITQKEKERGVEPGSIEIALVLESAKGLWDAAAIAQASPRVTALGLGRVDLTMHLGPVPQGEFRLHRFLMTRTVVAARMLGKQPLGAFWRPGSRGGVASKEASAKAAREGKALGFSGCFCASADQVAPVNEGYAA